MIEGRIEEILGYPIPGALKPLAAYVPAKRDGDLVFTSGQLPIKEGKLIAEGKVGGSVSVQKGAECARICAVNCLSAVKSVIGSLEKLDQIVKLVVYVNSAEGFTGQPGVANGASELLVEIFGEKGKHSRSAVGVAELPLDAPVEIEMIVRINN
jgi:enamine deaminase RidA (YjgF/YER057c/UK114 family)